MRKSALLLTIAAIGAFFISKIESWRTFKEKPAAGSILGKALVLRVIDGDTIEIEGGDPSAGARGKEIVRYLGIDAPETVDPRKPVQCFGKEAARENKRLVEGKPVRLEGDVTDRDKYGRLLRYVYLEGAASPGAGGTFVNLALVEEGYARTYDLPPDVKYAHVFATAESAARGKNIGLWKACAGN